MNAGVRVAMADNQGFDWRSLPPSKGNGRQMTEAQKAWLDANPMFEICGRGHSIRGYLLADGSIGQAGPNSTTAIAVGIRVPCADDPGSPADVKPITYA
jgi:hypothetical protein